MKDTGEFPIDLRELQRRKALGYRYVQLIVLLKRRPRTYRIRIMPGVLGVYIGETGHVGQHLADVLIDDLIKALEKRSEGT